MSPPEMESAQQIDVRGVIERFISFSDTEKSMEFK